MNLFYIMFTKTFGYVSHSYDLNPLFTCFVPQQQQQQKTQVMKNPNISFFFFFIENVNFIFFI